MSEPSSISDPQDPPMEVDLIQEIPVQVPEMPILPQAETLYIADSAITEVQLLGLGLSSLHRSERSDLDRAKRFAMDQSIKYLMQRQLKPDGKFEILVPFGMQWTITHIFWNSVINGLQSKYCLVLGFPGLKYSLLIQKNEKNVDLNLILNKSSKAENNFYVQLSGSCIISDRILSPFKAWYNSKNDTALVKSFSSTEFEDLFLNGQISFKLDGSLIMEKVYSVPVMLQVPPEIRALSERNDGKDFTVLTGDNFIVLHKEVLFSNSPYFELATRIHRQNLDRHNVDNPMTYYELDSQNPEAVETAINLFYGKKIKGPLTIEQAIELENFAIHYNCMDLKAALTDFVIVTPENVVEYIDYSIGRSRRFFSHCVTYLVDCRRCNVVIKNFCNLHERLQTLAHLLGHHPKNGYIFTN